MPAALSSRRSRRWIGFFIILAGLALIAITAPLVYNLSIQLRPDQLAQARQRWRENIVRNYDLEYLVKTSQTNQEEENAYLVQVRDGQVVLVVCNTDVVYLDPELALLTGLGVAALSWDNPGRFGISALFDEIEAALREDESSGKRNFAAAQFDPTDGHPFHYVHRVRSTKERLEWNIKFSRR